jgi:hypothetical protein
VPGVQVAAADARAADALCARLPDSISQTTKETLTMLVRDPYSGLLHEVPDSGYRFAQAPLEEAPDLSEYDVGETVYDGLGNPVGVLPFIPLIAKALPAIAQTVLPAISKILPKAASILTPPPPGDEGPPPPPTERVGPIAPPPGAGPSTVVAPGPQGPVVMRRRLIRRRRTYGR